MQLGIRVLGSNGDLTPTEVGQKVASYLVRGLVQEEALQASADPGAPKVSGAAKYYADSAGLRPGRWLLGPSGEVDPQQLASYLAGVDPVTGAPLLSAAGSSGRANGPRKEVSPDDLDRDWYAVKDAAKALGVSSAYVHKWIKKEAIEDRVESGLARDTRGHRLVSRELVLQLAESRKHARVVAGYDLTFSPVKSVSVLWAVGDEVVRTAILDAIDESIRAGVSYLERNAFSVRVKGRRTWATPVAAVDYLHTTSRALDPQLHHHVVVTNAAVGADGIQRALDGTMLFRHAKTAAFLAAAELRHQLTDRLGVRWTEPFRGISEIAGIPEVALSEVSKRSKEIDEAVGGRELVSAKARQVAAWSTRSAKVYGVDQVELFASWDERLEAAGFDEEARDSVLWQVDGPEELDDAAKARIFRKLLRVDGITEHTAVFDRRTAIQRLAELAGDRLEAEKIEPLADEFLALSEVVELDSDKGKQLYKSADAVTRADGRIIPMPEEKRYSTQNMLRLEQRALAAYEWGRTAELPGVDRAIIDEVLARAEFARLSEEQRAFVESLTGSSMRIQMGMGAAGSGKTTTLRAAVAVWEEAGYHVIGAAVGGTQAVKLSEEAGIDAKTVASILTRYYEHGDRSLVGERTVVLVDEASLVSTKDFAALADMTETERAQMRFVGDPAQHSSVEAGGVFRYLVERYPDETPQLTTLYRQQGPDMEEVRLANAEFREGKIREALERLERDGRITEAESPEEAYDLLTCAWYAERQKRYEDPTRQRSAMTAEHHRERRELNLRARALLEADGTLHGPELQVGELSFRAGDEVIARIADRSLRASGAPRDAFVRNGSVGVVRVVGDDSLTVDFERWGSVDVPTTYLEKRLPSGVMGGLQHSYALTTHVAQGETFATATPLVTDVSNPEGVYVGITRGQFDLEAVVVGQTCAPDFSEDDELPVLTPDVGALRSSAERLERGEPERLASERITAFETDGNVASMFGQRYWDVEYQLPIDPPHLLDCHLAESL